MEEQTKKPRAKKTEKTQPKSDSSGNLIAVVRIKGEVKVKPKVKYTLDKLRLRKKYVCILLNSDNKALMGMLNIVKHSVAFGNIERETLVKLIAARAQTIRPAGAGVQKEEKINPESAADELIGGKKLEELKIKPFFRLHPPRGGIDSKIQYTNGGVLGNNKQAINKLIERML